MRKTLDFVVFFTGCVALALSVNTHASDPRIEPVLMAGQCRADVFSKTYPPDEGGSQISFTCAFDCLDLSGRPQRIEKVLHRVDRRLSEVDGSVAVCDGVSVFRKVSQTGHVFWDFDRVQPFWAVENLRPEFTAWVGAHAVRMPEPQRSEKLKIFRAAAAEVATAYEGASQQYEPFRYAAEVLIEISRDSERGRAELNLSLYRLSQENVPSRLDTSKGLVDAFVFGNAQFLVGETRAGIRD